MTLTHPTMPNNMSLTEEEPHTATVLQAPTYDPVLRLCTVVNEIVLTRGVILL